MHFKLYILLKLVSCEVLLTLIHFSCLDPYRESRLSYNVLFEKNENWFFRHRYQTCETPNSCLLCSFISVYNTDCM